MERAGKRQDRRHHRGRHLRRHRRRRQLGRYRNLRQRQTRPVRDPFSNSPAEYRPTTPSGASFPSSTRGTTSKTYSSNGQNWSGKPRWDDAAGAFEYGERTRFASIEHDVFETVNKRHGRAGRRRRLGDLDPVCRRTRERPRRVGEHKQRCDDRVHAVGGRQDDGSQAALHNKSAGSDGSDSGGCEGALGSGERSSPDVSLRGEVAENRGGGEAEERGLGLGVSANDTPTRSIRCDCPAAARSG